MSFADFNIFLKIWTGKNMVQHDIAEVSRSKTRYKYLINCIKLNIEQDGRLAPAYFSPNYKYFDQFLQTVKNKTTVLILVFRVFTNINSTTDFCTLCKSVSRFSVEKYYLSHSAENIRRETLLCFRKFLVPKNVEDKRGAGITIFCQNCFVSQYRKTS